MIVEVIDDKCFQTWMTEKEDFLYLAEIHQEMILNWRFFKNGNRKTGTRRRRI